MAGRETLIEGLRGIHVPDGVALWPPAPGWWVLAGWVAALACLFAAVLFWKKRARRAALRELERAVAAYRRTGDAGRLAADCSVLMRRAALARYGSAAAGRVGASWLALLDSGLAGRPFTDGPGRALASAPYGGPPPADPEALIGTVRRWLRSLL